MPSPERAVYISNLPFALEESELRGKLEEIAAPQNILYYKDDGHFAGIAIAIMADASDAAKVVEKLQGSVIGGRNVIVKHYADVVASGDAVPTDQFTE